MLKALKMILISAILIAGLFGCKASTVACSGPGCGGNPVAPQQPTYIVIGGYTQPTAVPTVAPTAPPSIWYLPSNPGVNSPQGGSSSSGVYIDQYGRSITAPIDPTNTVGVVRQSNRDVELFMNGPDIGTFGRVAHQSDSTPILSMYFGQTYEVQGTWTSDRSIKFSNALRMNGQGGNIKFTITRDGLTYYNNWLNLHDNRVYGDGSNTSIRPDPTVPVSQGTVLYIQFGNIQ